MNSLVKHRNGLHSGRLTGKGGLCAFALVAMLVTGCQKWLDVTPQDKVPQKVLFSTEQGFKDALIGVYLSMDKSTAGGSYGLYTNHLSMGLLGVLAYDYDNGNVTGVGGNPSLYNAAFNYDYTNAVMQSEQLNIWKALYSNIANLNNILEQIDEKQNLFSGNNYALVKGEALGLRAMLHFDALRLWGESPGTGATVPAIPYVTEFTILTTPLTSVTETSQLAINDLQQARNLLAGTDTSSLKKESPDAFLAYTQNHLNYWALTGLMARVYQYMGNNDSAQYYAGAVIGSGKFPLVTSDLAFINNPVRDRTYSQEHLFALFSTNLVNYNQSIFNITIPLVKSFNRRIAVYATPAQDATDWRLRSWFDVNASTSQVVVPSKIFQDANLPYHLQGIMPLVRVSEMYYIASESTLRKGDISGAVGLLNKVRQARGLQPLNAAGITTTDSVNNAIMREYQKEFIQEGQTWYYYKRLNLDLRQVTGTPAAIPPNAYTFPLPDLEKEYRNG